MTEQCPSCGGFCKKSGCERADYVPPKRECVGLTDEEIEAEFGYIDELLRNICYRTQAMLKEKST